MSQRQDEATRQLGEALTDVASALYAIDSSGDLLFVRAQADAGNAAAQKALESLAGAWERYPLAKEAVDELEKGLAAGRHATVVGLLGRSAVALPDGTNASIEAVLTDVRKRAAKVATEVARIADGARQALLRLDAASTAARGLLVRAAAVGAGADPEITSLRPALDEANAAIVADPTAVPDLARLDRLVEAARVRVDALERGRAQFPADLAQARVKIDSPAGLLDPPDPRSAGLRPRLDAIRRQADDGDWAGAQAALEAWRHEADGWRDRVAAIAAANAAPLARRNELRGLLDAYRAKAVAHGRDEDGRLARLYEAAKDVLYTAPCVLAEGERLVQDYAVAVNRKEA